MPAKPFNPIEIPNIALILALEVLEQEVHSFPPMERPIGAGVYLLYYKGSFGSYSAMGVINSAEANPKIPVYVGKAERKGKRKGFSFDPVQGTEISSRLSNHRKSIASVDDLEPADFVCRYLCIEDAFIGLAESVLVSIFDPLWNRVLDGFGNNTTGGPRSPQGISRWDQFHAGRRRGAGDEKIDMAALEFLVKGHFETLKDISDRRLLLIRERIAKYGLG